MNEPLLSDVAALRRQPGFPAAFWIIIDRYLRIHAGALITKLVVSDARYWVSQMIMAMHAEYSLGQAESRLTVSALVRRSQAMPVAGISRGQVLALVALMRGRGRLVTAPGDEGRRDPRLIPSARMVEEQFGRTALQLEAWHALVPEAGHLARLNGEPRFFLELERRRGQLLGEWGNPLRHFPALARVVRHDACYTILACLMDAAGGRPALPSAGPCSMPYGEVAARIGSSRTQVRRIIKLLEAEGLLAITGRGGEGLALSTTLVEDLADFHALRLLRFDHFAREAAAVQPAAMA